MKFVWMFFLYFVLAAVQVVLKQALGQSVWVPNMVFVVLCFVLLKRPKGLQWDQGFAYQAALLYGIFSGLALDSLSLSFLGFSVVPCLAVACLARWIARERILEEALDVPVVFVLGFVFYILMSLMTLVFSQRTPIWSWSVWALCSFRDSLCVGVLKGVLRR